MSDGVHDLSWGVFLDEVVGFRQLEEAVVGKYGTYSGARLGLKPVRFHDMRHTHFTLLLLAGVSPHVVSIRLGHRSVAFTLRQYAHVLPQQQAEAAERLAERIYGPLRRSRRNSAHEQ